MDVVPPERFAAYTQEPPPVAQGGSGTLGARGAFPGGSPRSPRHEERCRALQTELAGLEGLRPVTAREIQDIQREVETRLADWRGLLTRQVAQSRQILKKLVVGRIVFRSRDDGTYEFSGQASLGRIITGLACTKTVVAPRGLVPFTTEFRGVLAA